MPTSPVASPRLLAALLFVLVSVAPAWAQSPAEPANEVYAVLRLSELEYPEGVGGDAPTQWSTWEVRDRGHALFTGPATGFLFVSDRDPRTTALPGATAPDADATERRDGVWLAVRAPAGTAVRGELALVRSGFDVPTEAQRVTIQVPAEAFSAEQRAAYLELRAERDAQRVRAGVAGAAYFRHRELDTLAELGLQPSPEPTPEFVRTQRDSVADTFELFSGARAISENLALDRRLPASDLAAESVPLSSIDGVEIPPYDWAPLIDGLSPAPDPLAALIPDDQYGLFFPSFNALMNVADHVQEFGAPVMETLEPRAVDMRTLERLEEQLALPRSVLARTVGPAVIRSVAITGAGYELRTGSDIALLFEAVDVDVLHKLLQARTRAAAGDVVGAGLTAGEIRDVSWELLSTKDRRLSCYLAKVGPAVVVCNSLSQLRRIVAAHEGRKANLATSPEYTFFRDRYPRDDPAESAFALLSDATIRRWCGPRWRIGASRIARGRAALLELQSRLVDELEAGVLVGSVHTPPDLADLGRVRAEANLLHSDAWGSRDFSTPVLELQIDAATEAEAALYERWRADYERNWREVFDPIALRISLDGQRIEFDVSVRPLQLNSDYTTELGPVRNGKLAPHAADPHDDAVLHYALAVDPEDNVLRGMSPLAMARSISPQLDPLQWLGGAVAVWADADPFWDEFAAAEETFVFLSAQLHRLPVALHADVRNGFALAAFLTGARATIEGSAPGLLSWETRQHHELPYVRVVPTPLAFAELGGGEADEYPALREIALYYVASGEGLTLSLNEQVVQRALERQQARRDAKANSAAAANAGGDAAGHTAPRAWLGEHVAFRVELGKAAGMLAKGFTTVGSTTSLQRLSWSNLPILNAWRERFPDADPVALHRRLWGEVLLCPGGGEYRFNARDGVMESSVYGHPGRPLEGPVLPPVVNTLTLADFGLTFEDDGLRARVALTLRE